MSQIPLGISARVRRDLPPVTLKNMFYEQTPENIEDQVALFPRHRLRQFATAGAGPIRGLFREGGVMAASGNSGKIICLSGGSLYRVDQNTGAAALIGMIEGPNRMSAEGNLTLVVLACGTKVYSTTGSTVTHMPMPDDYNVYGVDTLNSYFLLASDLGRFYWTAIGGTTVDALDYATAESQPDDLRTLKVIGDELWLFGRLSIEVWQPTGDLDLPFRRIDGRIFGIGITARDSAQKLSVNGVDVVCWVGTDRRVYITSPNPVEISDKALCERLNRVADPDAIYATTTSCEGHDFYVLHIPGEGSWAFDLSTKKWDEWTSYGRALFRGAVSAVSPNNQPLLGDDTSNQIFRMVDDQDDDEGEPVVFEWSGRQKVTGAPARCNNVLLECATGQSNDPEADPAVELATSDDDGETWLSRGTQSLGRQGEFGKRVMWRRLGLLRRPGRSYRWRTTTPTVVTGAKFNVSYR